MPDGQALVLLAASPAVPCHLQLPVALLEGQVVLQLLVPGVHHVLTDLGALLRLLGLRGQLPVGTRTVDLLQSPYEWLHLLDALLHLLDGRLLHGEDFVLAGELFPKLRGQLPGELDEIKTTPVLAPQLGDEGLGPLEGRNLDDLDRPDGLVVRPDVLVEEGGEHLAGYPKRFDALLQEAEDGRLLSQGLAGGHVDGLLGEPEGPDVLHDLLGIETHGGHTHHTGRLGDVEEVAEELRQTGLPVGWPFPVALALQDGQLVGLQGRQAHLQSVVRFQGVAGPSRPLDFRLGRQDLDEGQLAAVDAGLLGRALHKGQIDVDDEMAPARSRPETLAVQGRLHHDLRLLDAADLQATPLHGIAPAALVLPQDDGRRTLLLGGGGLFAQQVVEGALLDHEDAQEAGVLPPIGQDLDAAHLPEAVRPLLVGGGAGGGEL